MDFISETMNEELRNCLARSGVRENVLTSLEEDELHTVEHLEATSDNLLKQCGIRVGQILRLREGIKIYKDQQKECELTGIYPIPTSSPASQSSNTYEINPHASQLSSPLSPLTAMHSTPKSNQPASSSPCLESSSDIENQMPSSEKSHEVHCFAESKVLKNDGKWLQKYELPTRFSPRVSQALKEKKLCSSERNDMTRDITTSIMAYTSYPTKLEREHVAFLLIKKYPFLADKLGSGVGSWEQAIKNRLKNRRKNKPPRSIKRPSAKPLESIKPKKVQKILDLGRIPEKPEGETLETCREHASLLRKEMMKTSNRNACMIRELMDLTFPFRRERILIDPRPVEDVTKEYPALTLVSEFKSEFGRVMDDKTLMKTMANTFTCTLKPKVIALAKRRELNLFNKSLMDEMVEAISNDIANKSDVEDTAALLMLPSLMSSKGTASLLKICSDDESIDAMIKESVAPQLIGGGEIGDMMPLYLVVERKVMLKINSGISIAQALAMLMACYYIFNIEYPTSLKSVFVMLEATIMGQPHEAKKRVVVNKFLQELEFEH